MDQPLEETRPRTLNQFALARFSDAYFQFDSQARSEVNRRLLIALRQASKMLEIYQATESGLDLVIWSALPVEDDLAPAVFFEKFARALAPFRRLLEVKDTLWGFTRPSQYSRASRSSQEIDPFSTSRQPYLVIYPFSKTNEWYLMSSEARQGMMNEHIRIGKGFQDISQLLLYSFGLQNQEFVVVYETPVLPRFSDLVNELRDTEARRYTLRDTPLHTAIYHSAEETLNLWK